MNNSIEQGIGPHRSFKSHISIFMRERIRDATEMKQNELIYMGQSDSSQIDLEVKHLRSAKTF